MTGRFDQEPGKPYGHCITEGCDAEPFADRDAMQAHLSATLAARLPKDLDTPMFEGSSTTWREYLDKGGAPPGRSHSARTDNPTRPERIRSYLAMEVQSSIDDAINEVIEDAYRLLEDGDATKAEIAAALREVGTDVDFTEAWAEYTSDEDDLDEPPITIPHTALDFGALGPDPDRESMAGTDRLGN